MGEYATYRGESVKIGTCEDMYYLRYEHRRNVTPEPGNVNPVRDVLALRFRFPWPDEDGTARPGHDDDRHRYDRGAAIHALTVPATVTHYSVQFRADAGYLVSLPCPEGPQSVTTPPVTRNGFSGAVHLCQQKEIADGRVVPVMKCGGCGAKWRMEDADEITALVVACRGEADAAAHRWRIHPEYDGSEDGTARWWHTVADRIAAGAKLAPTLDPVPA